MIEQALQLNRTAYTRRALPKDAYWGLVLSGERIISKVPTYTTEEVAMLKDTFTPQIKGILPFFPAKKESVIDIHSDQDLYTILTAVIFADIVTGYTPHGLDRFSRYDQRSITESSAQIRKALQRFVALSIRRPAISVHDYFEESVVHLVKESQLLS